MDGNCRVIIKYSILFCLLLLFVEIADVYAADGVH